MLNAEKYREDIVKIIIDKKEYPAIDKRNKTLSSCQNFNYNCENCLFTGHDCEKSFVLWMLEEYKEPIVLTKREKAFIEMMLENEGYLARDEDNCLYWYRDKPTKDKSYGCWDIPNANYDDYPGTGEIGLNENLFPSFNFIKWEDKEPYSIIEIYAKGI